MNINNINEKIAYLKGLAEGLGTQDSKNGKLICGMLDLLSDMACLIQGTNKAMTPEKTEETEKTADEGFEVMCPFCNNRVFVEADKILESDDLSVECPNCGENIDVLGEENEGENSCDDCPGCANCPAEGGECDARGDLSF
ncbi:MAG: Lar family restriction alleviation protein [Oscillospiraceae bacterium]|nr:Lar family restriction alleviation protein [Oscillospiraceae bacterium]